MQKEMRSSFCLNDSGIQHKARRGACVVLLMRVCLCEHTCNICALCKNVLCRHDGECVCACVCVHLCV